MKRFIDIGHQMYLGNDNPKQFSFYCTTKDRYERFDDEDVWDNVEDFSRDYLAEYEDGLERYLTLIPDEFK